jgi:hypothetical protein
MTLEYPIKIRNEGICVRLLKNEGTIELKIKRQPPSEGLTGGG